MFVILRVDKKVSSTMVFTANLSLCFQWTVICSSRVHYFYQFPTWTDAAAASITANDLFDYYHLENSIKEKFRENGVYLAVIPGRLTNVNHSMSPLINRLRTTSERSDVSGWRVVKMEKPPREIFAVLQVLVFMGETGISTDIVVKFFKTGLGWWWC